MCGASLAAMAGDVAILNGQGGCDHDFDLAMKKLSIEPKRYPCNADGMKNFVAALDHTDMVLVVPLFNYNRDKNLLKDEDTDYAAVRRWIEGGGVMVVTEGNYLNVRGWVEKIDEAFKNLTTSKCTSSQWEVKGWSSDEEPVHPLRFFPNKIKEGDSWPHFDRATVKAPLRILASCSEGQPIALLHDLGKGAIIVTSLRQPSEKVIENYLAFAALKRAGLDMASFSASPISIGDGTIEMRLAREAKGKLVYEVAPVNGEARTFEAEFVDGVAKVDYTVKERGETSFALDLDNNGTRTALYRRTVEIPKFLTVYPNDYRGIISKSRRVDQVKFRAKLAPDKEQISGGTMVFTVSSQCVEIVSPKVTVESPDVTTQIVLNHDLPAGTYTLKAFFMGMDGSKGEDETTFEIVEPHASQCVVDDDGTLLVNGKPYFPLGMYHMTGDYERPRELGLNTAQFWSWEIKPDKYGMQTGLAKAGSYGFRVIFESNHSGEQVWRTWGERCRDNPAILMWEVDDEPSESDQDKIVSAYRTWHDVDRDHPTMLTSCRPDLFRDHVQCCDVFAFDPYGSKETPFDAVKKTADWCIAAENACAGRKPFVVVPHAFPTDPRVLKAVAYTALAHGARGLSWYCWSQVSGGPVGVGLKQHPECQEALSNLVYEINVMMPGLTSTHRSTFVQGDIHGMITGFKPRAWAEHFLILQNVSGEEREFDRVISEMKPFTRLADAFAPKVALKDKDGNIRIDSRGNVVKDWDYRKLDAPGHVKLTLQPYESRLFVW